MITHQVNTTQLQLTKKKLTLPTKTENETNNPFPLAFIPNTQKQKTQQHSNSLKKSTSKPKTEYGRNTDPDSTTERFLQSRPPLWTSHQTNSIQQSSSSIRHPLYQLPPTGIPINWPKSPRRIPKKQKLTLNPFLFLSFFSSSSSCSSSFFLRYYYDTETKTRKEGKKKEESVLFSSPQKSKERE